MSTLITVILVIGFIIFCLRQQWKYENAKFNRDWTLVSWKKYNSYHIEMKFANGQIIRDRDFYPSGKDTWNFPKLRERIAELENKINWGLLDDLRETLEPIPYSDGNSIRYRMDDC